MKHAEWLLRPFSFGNAIGSRPFSQGESDWRPRPSHNGQRDEIGSRPFSHWRARDAVGRGNGAEDRRFKLPWLRQAGDNSLYRRGGEEEEGGRRKKEEKERKIEKLRKN